MKFISAHQPAYLPWLGYIHKILLSDEFVLMDNVQFEKNSFINRNRIISQSGPIWLTIPVATKGYKKKAIRDMRVANHRWRDKHLKSIEQTYGKTRFFDEVMPILYRTLKIKSDFLVDYTNPSLFEILSYLEVNTPIKMGSEMKLAGKKLNYVIELTKRLQGSHFVFGALGREYANEKLLLEENVTPYFQNYQHPSYEQKQEPFTPYLSIVDALFTQGKQVRDLIFTNNIDRLALRNLLNDKR